jgi:hypothetical protein
LTHKQIQSSEITYSTGVFKVSGTLSTLKVWLCPYFVQQMVKVWKECRLSYIFKEKFPNFVYR